jgi:hypothetical protein
VVQFRNIDANNQLAGGQRIKKKYSLSFVKIAANQENRKKAANRTFDPRLTKPEKSSMQRP